MPVDREKLNHLLLQFTRRDPDASAEFKRIAAPILRQLGRRFGPDLAAGLLHDVASETYVILLEPTGLTFDPTRGSAYRFLFGIVRNAVQRVRAAYCPPGVRTRLAREQRPRTYVEPIPFDESVHSGDSRLLPDIQLVEARSDAAALLAGNPPTVLKAFCAVYAEGESIGDVAHRLGISRFKLYRDFRIVTSQAVSHSLAAQVRLGTREG